MGSTIPEQLHSELTAGYGRLLADCLSVGNMGRRVSRMRDLTAIELTDDLLAVIACDSNAGIGECPMDSFQTTNEELGMFMLKVPLMEILSAGAVPVLVACYLCLDSRLGEPVLQVIKTILKDNGFDPEVQLMSGIDEHAQMVQSGSGTTVIALAARNKLRYGTSREGDIVCALGVPKSRNYTTYSSYDVDVAKISTVMTVAKLPFVREIVPCGSHGIAYEAEELAKGAGLVFTESQDNPLTGQMTRSCGAASAAIASLPPDKLDELLQCGVEVPISRIGTLQRGGGAP